MAVSDIDAASMQAAFKEWDADGVGWIHKQVLLSVLVELTQGVPQAGLRSLVDLYDQRKDGMIDYQEFLKSICSGQPLPGREEGQGTSQPSDAAASQATPSPAAAADSSKKEPVAAKRQSEAAMYLAALYAGLSARLHKAASSAGEVRPSEASA
mmetsp:Transcript_26675/g.48904  ORF Transcript_26675/g.48904 Transcript_26675/m.48904 type:complete len:154 (+) Transcript_26675:63-524(+)